MKYPTTIEFDFLTEVRILSSQKTTGLGVATAPGQPGYGCGRSATPTMTTNWAGALGRYNFVATPQRGVSQNWVIMERWDPDKDAWVTVSKPGGAL